MTGARELKALVELGLLIEQLGNAPLSFLEEIDEGLAKQIVEIRGWLASTLAKWRELPAEVKVEQLASRADWRKSRFDEGEFVYVDEARELGELLEKSGGKLEAGGFAYYLRGNVIKRYRRKRAQPAAPRGGEAGRAENAR